MRLGEVRPAVSGLLGIEQEGAWPPSCQVFSPRDETADGTGKGGPQPHCTLGCRGHPPGGGARRDGGSSWTGGQPTGYWKTVALRGSALEIEKENIRKAHTPRPIPLPAALAVGSAGCLNHALEARASRRPLGPAASPPGTEPKEIAGLEAETELQERPREKRK